jgi:hypothetical protein
MRRLGWKLETLERSHHWPENLCLHARSQGVPDAHWLPASSPAFEYASVYTYRCFLSTNVQRCYHRFWRLFLWASDIWVERGGGGGSGCCQKQTLCNILIAVFFEPPTYPDKLYASSAHLTKTPFVSTKTTNRWTLYGRYAQLPEVMQMLTVDHSSTAWVTLSLRTPSFCGMTPNPQPYCQLNLRTRQRPQTVISS